MGLADTLVKVGVSDPYRIEAHENSESTGFLASWEHKVC